MTPNRLSRRSLLALPLVAVVLAPGPAPQTAQPKRTAYFPAGTWQHKAPTELVFHPIATATFWDDSPREARSHTH